jgi:hypothetical protein
MTPEQFKMCYKGEDSQLFKFVRFSHNKYLSNKDIDIDKMYKSGNWYGIVYKIQRIKDENGNLVNDGSIRIGKSMSLLSQRWAKYKYRSGLGYKGNKYHIHHAINKYGLDAFEREIIGVCQSRKEFIATEVFWTIYYNRYENKKGYDLSVNEYYNPIIGDLMEKFEEKIPKIDLTNNILKGLEVGDLKDKYGINTYETLNNLFEQYYGERSLNKIRSNLIAPLLEDFIKLGYNEEQVLNKLKESGIMFIDRYELKHLLLMKYCKVNFDGKRFDELRLENFIKPFLQFLIMKDIKIGDRFDRRELGLIEYLLMEDVGITDIMYLLGKCSPTDDEKTKSTEKAKIRGFIKTRWGMSYTDLREFLKKEYFPTELREEYLSIIRKSLI